jgi:hypothetical protein
MKPTAEDLAHLRGEQYSSGYTFRLARGPDPRTRFAYLAAEARGRRVLHLGCADHNRETILRKRAQGRWMHDHLLAHAAVCYGVDTDRPAVEFITRELGLPHVHVADLGAETPGFLADHHWDLVVLGELVEHLDNPVAFLAALRARLRGRADRLVVTVPNAFYHRNARHARRGVEHVNSDHRYWFTPYTLAKVAVRAGLGVEELLTLEDFRLRPFPPVSFLRLMLRPLLRSRVVLKATL